MPSEIKRWERFDRLSHDGASLLRTEDNCYFYMRRMHGGWDRCEANQKIFNLKTGPNPENTRRLHWRDVAIEQFSADLLRLIGRMRTTDGVALIPIPPSKRRDDPSYDDKIYRVCRQASEESGIPVLDVISQRESKEPYHENDFRRDPDEIQANLIVDVDAIPRGLTCVLLVDDVLTTGAHFIACKSALLEARPDLRIAGAFWAKQMTTEEELRSAALL